jgi:hypothetical protein
MKRQSKRWTNRSVVVRSVGTGVRHLVDKDREVAELMKLLPDFVEAQIPLHNDQDLLIAVGTGTYTVG